MNNAMERAARMSSEFNAIKDDFRDNLKPKLEGYKYSPLTKMALENIQMDIDFFLQKNDLKISVYVHQCDNQLYILGRTLIDEIVWEQIQ